LDCTVWKEFIFNGLEVRAECQTAPGEGNAYSVTDSWLAGEVTGQSGKCWKGWAV